MNQQPRRPHTYPNEIITIMYIDDGFNLDERANEPEVLRKLSKTAIFKLLSATYFLPDLHSRAINRRYLVRVYQHQVFRLPRTTLLEFESRLSLDEQVRSTGQSVPSLIQKANRILEENGELILGFDDSSLPDEAYTYRLLRYIDPFNTTGTFKRRVEGAPRPITEGGRM